MTYNVRSCRGMDGRYAPERIADVIAHYEPDVVALQEVDVGRARSGGCDQARAIGGLVGMQSHFHPAMRMDTEEYGDAILSRLPTRFVRAGDLPRVPRQIIDETRGALWVAVESGGAEVQVINTHFGLGWREPQAQAEALLGPEWLGAALGAGPVVICGDLNSRPGGRVHRMFTARLRDAQRAAPGCTVRNTFATRLPFICLDYVFVSEGLTVRKAQVLRTPLTRVASDHFPLVADLALNAAA